MFNPYNNQASSFPQSHSFRGNQVDPINVVLEPTPEDGALLIGGIDAATNPYILQSHQIGAVLTVSNELSNITFPAHINHMVIPVEDSNVSDISRFFAQAIDFIASCRNYTNVLVHCRVGASRSATLILAYLMKEFGMGLNEAFGFLKEKRWKIHPNPGFMNQLRQFERFVFHKRRSNSFSGLPFGNDINNQLSMSVAQMGYPSRPNYAWF